MVHLHNRICISFQRKCYDSTCLTSENVSEKENKGVSKGVTNHFSLLKQIKYWRRREHMCTIFTGEPKVHQLPHLPQFHPSVSILLVFHSSEYVILKCAAIICHYSHNILFIVKTVTENVQRYMQAYSALSNSYTTRLSSYWLGPNPDTKDHRQIPSYYTLPTVRWSK